MSVGAHTRLFRQGPRGTLESTAVSVIQRIPRHCSVPFDPSGTRELPFTRADGTVVEAPLMSRRGGFRYYAGRDYQAVRLPYSGDRLSMVIVLRARGSTSIDGSRGWTPGHGLN